MQNWRFVEWGKYITREEFLQYQAEHIGLCYIMLLLIFIGSNIIQVIISLYKYYNLKKGERQNEKK